MDKKPNDRVKGTKKKAQGARRKENENEKQK